MTPRTKTASFPPARALCVAALALALGATGCRGSNKCVPGKSGAGASGTKGAGKVPGTALPAKGAPKVGPSPAYDPSKDTANQTGFRFARKRSPKDPADARKEALTIKSLYDLGKVSDPRWSPNGKQILFSRTTHDLEAGRSNSDIYLVSADGSAPARRLTRHKKSDRNARWAPGGKSFLFLSSRQAGGTQIYRMALAGGDAEKLTSVSTGVSAPRWSPDGKLVAFASRVYPACGADDACNKALLSDARKNPIKAHLADELLYRHWTSYKDGRRSHVLVLHVATGKVADVTPGDFDTPAFGQGEAGFAFSPDSRELCVVSNRQAGSARAWTTNKDLLVVPARGGEVVNITAANKAFDGHPAYSPDGRHIAFLRQTKPGYEADRFRLALYDRKAGTVKVLSEGFDNWVLDFAWSDGGKKLVFKAPVKARFPLFSLDVQTGKIARLAVPSVRHFHVSSNGALAFTHNSVDRPSELYAAGAAGQNARRLTYFSKSVVQRVDLRPAEELWLPGAGGRKVHTFIIKPHGYKPGKRYPLIINVHGGPQYQWSDAFRGDWQVYPGAGYVVAFFNPHGSIGYGQAYTAAISKDWGGKVYQDVLKVTEALAKLPYVDAKRVGAMGWSYGGYMMNWLMGQTDRFKAYVSMMGIYDLASFYAATEELWFPEWDLGGPSWDNAAAYAKWSPSTYAKKFSTPTLIITGEKDYRVPYTQSLQLFTALRRRGVAARLIVFPNDGHWPSYVASMPLYYAAHLDWFHRYLGGAPSPYEIKKMVQGRAFKKK